MGTIGEIAGLVAKSGHAVDVERAAVSEDEAGGRERVWGVVAAAAAAWVQPASARTAEAYGGRNMVVTHSVYFAIDPGIEMGDRLKFDGRYLAVHGICNEGELNRLWRVDCEER